MTSKEFEVMRNAQKKETDLAILRELDSIRAEIKEYGSIWVEWNDGMTKEEIVESVAKQAKDCILAILEEHIRGVEV